MLSDYAKGRNRMKTDVIILCAAAALLSPAPSFSQDLHKQSVGTIVKSQFVVGKKRVLLPDGDWVLIGASETIIKQTGSGAPWDLKWGNVLLAQIDGKSVRALVRVQGSIDAWNITRWTDKSECERTNLLFVNDLSRHIHDFFCNVINHRAGVLSGDAAEGSLNRRAYLWLEEKQLSAPATMLVVEYYRSTIPGNYLRVQYYFNPEYDGFAPSAKSGWSQNDWHKDLVGRDARKVTYVETLKAWSKEMAPVVDKGFKNESVDPGAYARWPATKSKPGT
jgi:hypothetical protein